MEFENIKCDKPVCFTAYGKPIPKARPRLSRYGTYTPKTTVEYERLVRSAYINQVGTENQITQPIVFQVDFYFEIPKSYTKKVKSQIHNKEVLHCKKPDTDNLYKSVSDALNGIAYTDDNQIVQVVASKYYICDESQPRAEIKLHPIPISNNN